ncbi:MAG: hypothetical protein IJ323_02565 [Clostridia bacterium]|nr:hypothetical protein [Clostridia bacterium]
MKKILTCFMLLLLLVFSLSCAKESGAEEKESTPEEKAERYYETIRSIGTEGIEVEVKSVNMWNDYEGTAAIIATIPDYTELFVAVYGEKDMTKALAKAIRREEFTTIKYEGTVPVSVVAGEQVVNSEDTVKDFVEKELIKAINAVMDLEGAE